VFRNAGVEVAWSQRTGAFSGYEESRQLPHMDSSWRIYSHCPSYDRSL